MKKLSVPHFKQETEYTCGPASLRMAFQYYGKDVSEKTLADSSDTSSTEGTLTEKMTDAVRKNGLYAYEKENASVSELIQLIDKGIPVVLNFMDVPQDSGHFATLVGYTDTDLIFNDPWNGPDYALPRKGFEDIWHAKWEPKKGWLLAISDTEISA